VQKEQGERSVERHVEEPEICYGDDCHPEHDRDGCLWSKYTCPQVRRFGSGSADPNPYCCINADMDTDADRDLYGHTYRDGDAHCYYYTAPYGHAYRDGDAYHHFYRHACPERGRRATANSDACPERSRRACPAYGHADASVSFLA
jgi:hypothetical protein